MPAIRTSLLLVVKIFMGCASNEIKQELLLYSYGIGRYQWKLREKLMEGNMHEDDTPVHVVRLWHIYGSGWIWNMTKVKGSLLFLLRLNV